MSIFGKVLIIFNLLAAGAFAYVTLENWKVRQELTSAAIKRQVLIDGIAVEEVKVPAEELDDDRVAFHAVLPGGNVTSISKELFDSIIPAGDSKFGGAGVSSQTEELVRVQKKVGEILAAEKKNPASYYQWLQAYLLSVARTGRERDGINALFDQRDAVRSGAARRDLPLLARTSSQTAALQTLVEVSDLGDPQSHGDTVRATKIAAAREAVKRFLIAEVPHGAGGADKAESERLLKNELLKAFAPGAGQASIDEVKKAANAEGVAAAWDHLAKIAVEPLTSRASTDKVIDGLSAYAQEHAVTDTERAALADIKNFIHPPLMGWDDAKKAATIETVALNLLNAKFDEAAKPAGEKTAALPNPLGEKARKIAHLLYHIDGWRHLDRTATGIADRKAWHERVATVVGLPSYIRAAEAQATEYAEAGQRLITAISEEQGAFEADYQSLQQRVLFLYSQWLSLDAQHKAQLAVTGENVRLKDERLTERNKLLADLKQAEVDAAAALVKLKKTQDDLFTIQKSLRDAEAALLVLERQLRNLELPEEKKRDGLGR